MRRVWSAAQLGSCSNVSSTRKEGRKTEPTVWLKGLNSDPEKEKRGKEMREQMWLDHKVFSQDLLPPWWCQSASGLSGRRPSSQWSSAAGCAACHCSLWLTAEQERSQHERRLKAHHSTLMWTREAACQQNPGEEKFIPKTWQINATLCGQKRDGGCSASSVLLLPPPLSRLYSGLSLLVPVGRRAGRTTPQLVGEAAMWQMPDFTPKWSLQSGLKSTYNVYSFIISIVYVGLLLKSLELMTSLEL